MSSRGSSQDSPQLVRVLWRGAMFASLVAFFTVSAMVMRALVGGFGWEAWPLALAVGTTLLCGALVLPLAVLVELPDAICGHWIPERRVARGRCPACGYRTAHASTAACSECGAGLRAPAPYAVTWRTLQRWTIMAILAWILGCALGLTLVMRDEHAFMAETQARLARDETLARSSRARDGVVRFGTLQWSASEGFSSPAPFLQAKERVSKTPR